MLWSRGSYTHRRDFTVQPLLFFRQCAPGLFHAFVPLISWSISSRLRLGELGAILGVFPVYLDGFMAASFCPKVEAARKSSTTQRPVLRFMNNHSVTTLGRSGKREATKGRKMADEKRAELYTSPGGKFIRADTLPRMPLTGDLLGHHRSRATSSGTTANSTSAKK